MELQEKIPVFVKYAEFTKSMEKRNQFTSNFSEEGLIQSSESWTKFLKNKRSLLICCGLLWLIAMGVLSFGCMKHPHGKYEVTTKVLSFATENVTPEDVCDDVNNIELLNENSSHFIKVFNVDRKYWYENTIYFDRLVYVSEITLKHPGELMEVIINGLDERTFKSLKQSTNKVNIKVRVDCEELPGDIMFMDMKTIRDPKGNATWVDNVL